MKVNFSGSETINVAPQDLWNAVIEPSVLQKCVPGCTDMRAVGDAEYVMTLDLKVAAVGGSFKGKIALSDLSPPNSCTISVSGQGTLGTGTGTAKAVISDAGDNSSTISYEADGDVGGLVAGVGQRVLMGVAKHLTRQFFTALKAHFAAP